VYSTLQSGPEFRRWKAAHKPSFFARRNRRARTNEAPACRIVRNDDTLEITLDRPEKHNAFSSAMRDALSEALNLALLDDSIQDVVLKGEGRSFCSGGDLDEFGSFPDPAVAHATRTTRSPAFLMAQLAGRIRCEVQGACLGAGAELPSFSGQVVADEGAVFGLPELSLGLIPGAGGTVSLPRRIGLSGARIDARTALDWGLVDEVRLAHH
jgi:enoyl-CoA hydratase/carnithine racemase